MPGINLSQFITPFEGDLENYAIGHTFGSKFKDILPAVVQKTVAAAAQDGQPNEPEVVAAITTDLDALATELLHGKNVFLVTIATEAIKLLVPPLVSSAVAKLPAPVISIATELANAAEAQEGSTDPLGLSGQTLAQTQTFAQTANSGMPSEVMTNNPTDSPA